MERKKRNLMVVLIAAVIVVAILASFGLRLFVPDTAKIVLPTPAASASPGLEPGTGSGLVRVDVTPETVQTVIGQTLTRPESYFREVTIEDFWGDGEQSSTTARVWVDGGWTMTESAMADGAIRHTIVGEGQFWLWYDGDRTPVTGPADERSADLEGQRIPTYEDVLSLDTADIAAAGYEERGGLACVWTQTAPDALGYVETYWVAVDSGLLVSSRSSPRVITSSMSSPSRKRNSRISSRSTSPVSSPSSLSPLSSPDRPPAALCSATFSASSGRSGSGGVRTGGASSSGMRV